MLINLNYEPSTEEKKSEYLLKFDLPPLTFESDTYVHINEIDLVAKESFTSGIITSSLIDKSPQNPRQQLLAFRQTRKLKSLFYTPTAHQKYKIQCSNFENSEFTLKLKEEITLEEIYIQLEVTHARI